VGQTTHFLDNLSLGWQTEGTMARLARIVVPGLPHHLTQRGNRRMEICFTPEDRQVYLALLRKYLERHGLQVYAYCLMTNHLHLVAMPPTQVALSRTPTATTAVDARTKAQEDHDKC
jgi:REP element-mobilizing transposase RayT